MKILLIYSKQTTFNQAIRDHLDSIIDLRKYGYELSCMAIESIKELSEDIKIFNSFDTIIIHYSVRIGMSSMDLPNGMMP